MNAAGVLDQQAGTAPGLRSVLLLNQFFHPDQSPTAVLLTDVARGLAASGVAVRVIAASGGYGPCAAESCDGVDVVRVSTCAPGRGTSFPKLAASLLYFLGLLWHGLAGPRPDVIVCLTTPPMLACAAYLLKLLRGSKLVIWEMDVYPDIAVALGVLRAGSPLTRLLRRIATFCRNHAQAVIVLGACMRERLIESGVSSRVVHVAENWADGGRIRAADLPPSPPLRLIYSGNLGLAHDIETLFGAMQATAATGTVQFRFTGGGVLRRELERRCAEAGMGNVRFDPYLTEEGLNEAIAASHAGVVTMRTESLGAVVPSKLYAFLAAGRPVLFVGPLRSATAEVLRRYGCGWQVDPGQVQRLSDTISHLASNPGAIETAARNARMAFENEFNSRSGVARICRVIRSAA